MHLVDDLVGPEHQPVLLSTMHTQITYICLVSPSFPALYPRPPGLRPSCCSSGQIAHRSTGPPARRSSVARGSKPWLSGTSLEMNTRTGRGFTAADTSVLLLAFQSLLNFGTLFMQGPRETEEEVQRSGN